MMNHHLPYRSVHIFLNSDRRFCTGCSRSSGQSPARGSFWIFSSLFWPDQNLRRGWSVVCSGERLRLWLPAVDFPSLGYQGGMRAPMPASGTPGIEESCLKIYIFINEAIAILQTAYVVHLVLESENNQHVLFLFFFSWKTKNCKATNVSSL